MGVFQIIVLFAAIVFAVLWSYQCRIKLYYGSINIATLSIIALWWILLIIAVLKAFNPIHLIWLFPLIIIAMPILYYKIPGLRYPSVGFYLPCLLLNDILKFILTLIPPRNNQLIKMTRTIVGDFSECVTEAIIKVKNCNFVNDIESILKKSIQKYKNVDSTTADNIMQKSISLSQNPNNTATMSSLCLLFVFDEFSRENREPPNSSQRKTINKTIAYMLADWQETIKLIKAW